MDEDLTQLLADWQQGDREALEQLMPRVYEELRRLARRYLASERADHTLEPTDLVHEAYVRLAGMDEPKLESRVHFFALAARLLRRLLVDHARLHAAAKRGGGMVKLSLEVIQPQEMPGTPERAVPDLLALDDALSRLAELDPRKGQILELRFFGGLTLDETAEALGVSAATVVHDSRLGRAWLLRELEGAREA